MRPGPLPASPMGVCGPDPPLPPRYWLLSLRPLPLCFPRLAPPHLSRRGCFPAFRYLVVLLPCLRPGLLGAAWVFLVCYPFSTCPRALKFSVLPRCGSQWGHALCEARSTAALSALPRTSTLHDRFGFGLWLGYRVACARGTQGTQGT